MSPRDAILAVLAVRAPGKSICPSEAARHLAGAGEWRPRMAAIREAGRALAADSIIEVTKKGKAVDPKTVKGVIRYRMKGTDYDHG